MHNVYCFMSLYNKMYECQFAFSFSWNSGSPGNKDVRLRNLKIRKQPCIKTTKKTCIVLCLLLGGVTCNSSNCGNVWKVVEINFNW